MAAVIISSAVVLGDQGLFVSCCALPWARTEAGDNVEFRDDSDVLICGSE